MLKNLPAYLIALTLNCTSMLTNAGEKELLVTWNRRKTALNCKNSPSKVHNKHHIGRKGIPYVHKKVLHIYEVMKSLHTYESITYL